MMMMWMMTVMMMIGHRPKDDDEEETALPPASLCTPAAGAAFTGRMSRLRRRFAARGYVRLPPPLRRDALEYAARHYAVLALRSSSGTRGGGGGDSGGGDGGGGAPSAPSEGELALRAQLEALQKQLDERVEEARGSRRRSGPQSGRVRP